MEKITKKDIAERVTEVFFGIRSEQGNLIYDTTGQPGERQIKFMQKDTPENRANLNKLFQEEVQRQYDEIIKEREKKLILDSIQESIKVPRET